MGISESGGEDERDVVEDGLKIEDHEHNSCMRVCKGFYIEMIIA